MSFLSAISPRNRARRSNDGAVHEKARAKVNLTLHIKGKRPDGYHELESLVAFADIADELVFTPGPDDSLDLDGPFAELVDGENLVLKAKRATASWLGVPMSGRFVLTKNIPVAAGLGGGSSDAAAAIRALLRSYDGGATLKFVERSAAIGADVPVCLQNGAALMCGLGERVTPVLGLTALPALLVNPRIKLSTAAVFKTLNAPILSSTPKDTAPAFPGWAIPEEAAAFLKDGRNDLEPPAKALEPAVGEVLDTLRRLDGSLLARLSGSGPTCFAIFSCPHCSASAAEEIQQTHPGWWVRATTLS